jgi:hypothetical protein
MGGFLEDRNQVLVPGPGPVGTSSPHTHALIDDFVLVERVTPYLLGKG